MKWVEQNCEVKPVEAALRMRRSQRQELSRMLGDSFIDTILIASEPGNILYSDDERLRSIARSEFNVDGVWTQAALMHCKNSEIIERSEYNEMIIKLACSYYHQTSVDPEILIESAKQANWSPDQPFRTVSQILSGAHSDDSSAVIVGANFLYELWKQPILPERRGDFVLGLLNAITMGRARLVILQKLTSAIQSRFRILPLAEREILYYVNLWRRLHLL